MGPGNAERDNDLGPLVLRTRGHPSVDQSSVRVHCHFRTANLDIYMIDSRWVSPSPTATTSSSFISLVLGLVSVVELGLERTERQGINQSIVMRAEDRD